MLKISALSKSYGKKQVLSEVNLELADGEICGIVGKNGAGKTTLFRCIAGLESPDSMKLNASPEPFKNNLGFLPASPPMLKRITGREYLTLMCMARGVPLPNWEACNIFDLPLHHFAYQYSTGMRKKLAFLGLLLQKNYFFILDEPFSGVDIYSNDLIVKILLALKQQGKSILLSSHIYSTLQDTCDFICFLKNGRFEEKIPKDHFKSVATLTESTVDVEAFLNSLNT